MHSLNWPSPVIRLVTIRVVIREASEMEADPETQSQTLVFELGEFCLGEGGGIIGPMGVKDIGGKPIETDSLAHGNSQSLNQQPSLHGPNLCSI